MQGPERGDLISSCFILCLLLSKEALLLELEGGGQKARECKVALFYLAPRFRGPSGALTTPFTCSLPSTRLPIWPSPKALSPIQSHRCALGMRLAVQGQQASGLPWPTLALPAAGALSIIYLLYIAPLGRFKASRGGTHVFARSLLP